MVGWSVVSLLSQCLLVVLGRTLFRLITQIPNDLRRQAFCKIRLLSGFCRFSYRVPSNVFVSTQCRFVFGHYRANVCCKFRINRGYPRLEFKSIYLSYYVLSNCCLIYSLIFFKFSYDCKYLSNILFKNIFRNKPHCCEL